jgi:acetyltransferase EpsM
MSGRTDDRLQRVIVIGGGEHARVVIDTIRSRPDSFELLGFVDTTRRYDTETLLDVEQLGSDSDALKYISDVSFVLGIGAIGPNALRREVVRTYETAGARFVAVVHRAAWVSPAARIGHGSVVMNGAQVNAGARVGQHTVINTSAIVEHDCVVDDYAQLAPGAILGGGVVVERGAYLGLGCRVRDHVRIGFDAMVALGAVVVRNVADGELVMGIPARTRVAGDLDG